MISDYESSQTSMTSFDSIEDKQKRRRHRQNRRSRRRKQSDKVSLSSNDMAVQRKQAIKKCKTRSKKIKIEISNRTKSSESKKSKFSETDLKKAQCAIELDKLQKKLMKYT